MNANKKCGGNKKKKTKRQQRVRMIKRHTRGCDDGDDGAGLSWKSLLTDQTLPPINCTRDNDVLKGYSCRRR